MDDNRGIISSLFDFTFSHFIAPKLLKFIYILGLLGAATAGFAVLRLLMGIGSGFFGKLGGLLLGIPAGLLIALFAAMYFRVIVEMMIVAFRGVEYLKVISERDRIP